MCSFKEMYVNPDTPITKTKLILSSITLTEDIYDPKHWTLESVKDNITITPVIYNEINFMPERKIILTITPEMCRDFTNLCHDHNDGYLRQTLSFMLNEILNNPLDYTGKGYRGVILRGIFE